MRYHAGGGTDLNAYKNIEDVVETLVEAGLTRKIVKLVPLAVIKGD